MQTTSDQSQVYSHFRNGLSDAVASPASENILGCNFVLKGWLLPNRYAGRYFRHVFVLQTVTSSLFHIKKIYNIIMLVWYNLKFTEEYIIINI